MTREGSNRRGWIPAAARAGRAILLLFGLAAGAQEPAPPALPSLPEPRIPAVPVAPAGVAAPLAAAAPAPAAAPVGETEDVARVTPAMAKMYEAMVNIQDGLYDEAIPKLEWVIETDPSLYGAWEALCAAYWQSGRHELARRTGERFLAIAPQNPRAHNFLAQVATSDGDLDRAEELYRKSLALNPNQYDARFSYARVLFWNGKRDLALAELKRLYQEDTARLDVEIQLARAYYANEEYELSLEHWNNINDMVPDYPEYMIARAQVLVLIGALKEAQLEAERVLEVEPDNEAALNLLTDISMRARQHDEVIKNLRRVRDLAKGDLAKAKIARRLAYYLKSQYDRDPKNFTMKQCVQAAQDAYRWDPGDVDGVLFYAEMLVLDKEYGRAEEHFRDVLQNFNPHNLRAKYGIYETYLGRMKLDEAEAQLESVINDFDPSDPYRHYFWAQLYFAQGRYFDAQESLERLEQEGAEGSVFTLLYHGLSPSEWAAVPSVRQFRDHMMTLKREGYKFIQPEQLADYFAKQKTPDLVEKRSLLTRLVQAVRRSFSEEQPEPVVTVRDYSPERVVCVTFDDGMRGSFRWATPVAEELRIPLTMYVPVGNILSNDIRIASWPELRAYERTGWWTIGSHLMDGSTPTVTNRPTTNRVVEVVLPATTNALPATNLLADLDASAMTNFVPEAGPPMITNRMELTDADIRRVHPLPNLLWVREKDRQETLREYYRRIRYEFLDSRNWLRRELELPEGILSVSYPMSDVGQQTYCNIDLFNVPEAILNEAELHYRMGFRQSRFGYAMKRDNPMLYQRLEPDRHDSGQDLLRDALRNHPVFLARRTRAEMAAQQGEMHTALEMVELLKRDNYPEEDLAELSAYIQRRLARLVAVPEAVNDETDEGRRGLIDIRHPYLGVEGESVKANAMIDEWHVAVKGGFNVNPRWLIEGRAGYGSIAQEVKSNEWVEVFVTNVTTRQTISTTTENGTNSLEDETIVSFVQTLQGTNIVHTTNYSANETMIGLASAYIFPNGSVAHFDLRQRSFDGDLAGESVIVYSLEYMWRPALAIDMAIRYEHDMMPSAREIIEYDGAALGAVWRVRDGWNATGQGVYRMMDDDNSLLRVMAENFWRISQRYDIWVGLQNSLVTTDMDSDLYWTPYWDQRHVAVIRVRRTFPNYYGMVRVNVGLQKAKGRPEDIELYRSRAAVGELQGWYPGEGPDEDWNKVVGVGASVVRRWANGWEIKGETSINAIGETTERHLTGSLIYRF